MDTNPLLPRLYRLVALALTALSLSAAPAAWAQPDLTRKAGPTLADQPSDIYRFDRFALDSADGRRHYRVQLAIPRRAAPPAGFPVLYLLDGNAAFADLTADQLAALDAQDRPLVIAAIGYDTELRFDVLARAFDYTPPASDGADLKDAQGRPAGGAEAFFDLIETRIKPAVQARAAVDPQRQALWGHSYGGLFVLHALLRHPGAFQTYIAADPALWWRNGLLLREEPDAAPLPAGSALRLRVITGQGARGDAAGPPGTDAATVQRMRQARGSAPPDAARQFVARQAQRPGLQATLTEFPGVAHGPLLTLSLGPALEWAADAPRP